MEEAAIKITNGRQEQQQAAELAIRMPDTGGCSAAVAAEPVTMAEETGVKKTMRVCKECGSWRWDAAAAMVRTATAAAAAAALALMVTAKERGTLNVFGLNVPLYSNWTFSDSLEYLVAISVAVMGYSLLQLILIVIKLVKKLPAVTSRTHAWILFCIDQIFAYVMISAGSAAAGVTNLNRTGIRHSALPDFCKPLQMFCDHMAISIAFAFFSFICLAMSALIDVMLLSKM